MYFITIVTHNREYLFGEIVDDEMVLNNAGRMIHKIWCELPEIHDDIDIDECVIMPNHIHGILTIGVNLTSFL